MPDSPGRRRLRACAMLLTLVVPGLAAGCARSPGPAAITVLANPSLKEVLDEMGTAYGQTEGTRLKLQYGALPEVADRLSGRDAGDVLVTADAASMDEAGEYLTGHRRPVARNSLTIAVAPGNPHRIRGLRDLTDPRLRVVVGAGTVPVGRYTRQALSGAGLTLRENSHVISARAVLDRVRAGDADAGIVYITDMRSAGVAASSVPIPADLNVTATFTAATIKDGDREEAADAFVSWLATPHAQELFNKYGFVTARRDH